jgi:plasmid stabilization system protein ParE
VTRPYRLTRTAQRNVDEIVAFIAKDSKDAASRLLDALEQAFERLAAMPGIGHSREDLTEHPVKFWTVRSYLIIYNPKSFPLTIVAVLHGSREVEYLLKSLDL